MQKISKFYLSLIVLLFLLTFLVILVVKTIFSSMTISNQIDQEFLESQTPRLQTQNFEEVEIKINEQKAKILDLKI